MTSINIVFRRFICILCVAQIYALASAQTSFADDSWNQQVCGRLDSLMQDSLLLSSQVGLMVWDLDVDTVVYRQGERQRLRPASTQKVMTAIAAIDRLGGDYQFKTELR